MARRGRFGRSETGASDLSATIRSLVQQQAAQEESVFMKAFYDGTEYNGSIPTMSDVIAFYERIAGVSGIARGTEDWIAFEQKIGDANNFDIKRTYNELVTQFNLTDGANYGELIDFITGRAMTSTDQGDLDTYRTGVEDITTAFLKYQGQALSRGELTAQEYQRITLEALQVLEPGSKQYESAMYDAFTYEWNALSTIWSNRVKAGKVSESQFTKWAKGFASRVEAAGIGKKTELYSGIFATIASYAGGPGGGNNSPAAKRANDTIKDIGSLLTLSAAVTGVNLGKTTLYDMSDPGSTTLKTMANNPEAMLLLADFLDQNPDFTSPILTKLGISDGDGLRTWVNDAVRNGQTDAAIVAANGGTDNTDLWYGVAVTNGAATGMDEYAFSSSKWAKDLANAAGNDVLIAHYNAEWKKYLEGQKSIYGTLPDNLGTAENVALYQAELLAANGQGAPGAPTLSGVVNDAEIDWASLPATEANANDLMTGNAVMNYDSKTGQFETVGRQAALSTTGALKQITFSEVNGQLIPYTISVTGSEVVDESGAVIAYVYQKPSGEQTIVSTSSGNVITGVTLLEDDDKFVIGEGTPDESSGKPPKIDQSILYVPGRDNFTDPSKIREGIANLLELGTGNALNELERKDLETEVAALTRQANLIEADNIEANARPDDIQAKIKAAELRGEQSRIGALNWFAQNSDIVSFDQNGKPTLDYAKLRDREQAGASSPVDAAQTVLGSQAIPFAIRPVAAIGAFLGNALTRPNIGMEFQAAMLNSRTEKEIERDRALGMRLPTSDNYMNRVNQATQSSNVFFRNLATPTQPESPYPIARPSVVPVAAPPTPKAVVPVKPNTPVALTPFNPQDPEARRALIAAQTKKPTGGQITDQSRINPRSTAMVAK